jgi:uncharacterized protein YtpQ (UPF0354 family)
MTDWRASLSNPQLGADEFMGLCVVALKDLYPDTAVNPTEETGKFQLQVGERQPFTVYLNNLWRNCRLDPENRAAEVERFLRIMVGAGKESSDSPPSIHSIVPTIKDEEYLRVVKPQDGSEHKFVHEHLVADLWIIYSVDLPERIVSFQRKDFGAMKMGLGELQALAIKNLRNILPPIKQHGEGPLYMLTAGGDYVASLILLDEIWDEMQTPIEGEIVVGIPSRDVLLFTGSGSKAGILSMRSRIDRITESGSYVVSRSMLRREKGKWVLFS